MKILVSIANHGTKNDVYARRVVEEYQGMHHDVHIVMLSNVEKEWCKDLEVVLGYPTSDPWSLPFGHKKVFAERVDDYDLFIYSEDDTLVTEANIASFLAATAVLPDDEIAGFLRSERTADGDTFLSSVHSYYHWDPRSVRSADGWTFAYYTNEHAACYLLTQDQLRRAIASGGFLVPPHEHRYDLLVTAATDPYTQCGFRKLIPISHLDQFLLAHLPSAYLGQLGLSRGDIDVQIEALRAIERGDLPAEKLLEAETRCWHSMWSKSYYETCPDGLVEMLPAGTKTVLSVGCGWGATEAALETAGLVVTAVALDPVIGAAAAGRGIEVVSGTLARTAEELAGRKFDAVLFCNVLHLFPDPVHALGTYCRLLEDAGSVIVVTPNFEYLPIAWRRFKQERGYRGFRDFDVVGFHPTTLASLRVWFDACGMAVAAIEAPVQRRWAQLHRWTFGLVERRWAREIRVTATPSRLPAHNGRP